MTISPLIQLHGNQLPTQLRVVFQADITTRYSTSITGQLSYAWDFGDGSPLSSGLSPTTSHTFGSEADITVRCTVSSPAGSVSTSQNFSVFEGEPESEWGRGLGLTLHLAVCSLPCCDHQQ